MSCKNLHKSATVAVNEAGTATVVTFADAPTGIINAQRFCFCIGQQIPSEGLTLPVQLAINGAMVPLWNRYGNPVLGADLMMHYVNKGWFGTENNTHVIATTLPKTACHCGNYCYN